MMKYNIDYNPFLARVGMARFILWNQPKKLSRCEANSCGLDYASWDWILEHKFH